MMAESVLSRARASITNMVLLMRLASGRPAFLARSGLVDWSALLGIMGGVFVAEVLSVMIQVSWFKFTKKRYGEGRRIFKMAPLHHHFELIGWAEPKVITRFLILAILFALCSLTTLKLR